MRTFSTIAVLMRRFVIGLLAGAASTAAAAAVTPPTVTPVR